MTPEDEKKLEAIKTKKAEREAVHQEARQKMDEAKKEVADLIAKAKAKAVKKKP